MSKTVRAISFFGLAFIAPTIASAEPLVLTCSTHDVGAPTGAAAAPALGMMTLRYDGDGAGTLSVKGPSGDMALPARKETRDGVVVQGFNDGKPYSVIGIRAAGPANVLMPDQAGIEACVVAKLTPDDAKDPDLTFMATMSCTAAALDANRVPISASIEIALTSIQTGTWDPAAVFMTREFAAPSMLTGGKIKIESTLTCEIEKI